MVAELNAIPILCVLNAFFDVIFMLLINENIFFTKLVSAFYVIPKSFLTGPVKKNVSLRRGFLQFWKICL